MPYQPLSPLLTTLTTCKQCWCTVAHLDQRAHDEKCPARRECCRDQGDAEPVLEVAS